MSDTPKWAPGPYRTYRNEIGEGETGIAAGSTCEGFRKVGVAFGDSIEQANAQAKLFAAAPELYEVLEPLIAFAEGYAAGGLLNELQSRFVRERCQIARAILAKARGER